MLRLVRANLTTKPEGPVKLKVDHPLSYGLTLAYLFREAGVGGNKGGPTGGFSVLNYANPAKNGIITGGATIGNVGRGLYFSGSDITAPVGQVATGLTLTKKFTLLYSAYQLFNSASFQLVIQEDGTNFIGLGFSSGLGSPRFSMVDLSPVNFGVAVPNFTQVALTREGDSITNGYKAYQNGAKVTQANTGTYAPTLNFTVGFRASSITQAFGGILEYVYIWNRALTPTEIAQIYASPYQIFVPIGVDFFSTSPAITAALTGVSASGSVGLLSPKTDIALSGLAAAGAVGTLGVPIGIGLSGVQATGAVGSVSPATSVGLAGVVGAGSVGTIGEVTQETKSAVWLGDGFGFLWVE